MPKIRVTWLRLGTGDASSFKDCPHWAIHNNFSFCLPISWGYVLVTYFPFKHKDDESVGSSPHLLYIHDWLIVNNGWCKTRRSVV